MADAPFFPLFVNLSCARILIVGAGHIALRRARALIPFARDITVVAPEVLPALEQMAREGSIVLIRRCFQADDLEQMHMALAATNDTRLNAEIGALCHEKGVLFNTASDQKQCDFFFPGIARRENIVIGVSTSGANHTLTKQLTERLNRWDWMENDQ